MRIWTSFLLVLVLAGCSVTVKPSERYGSLITSGPKHSLAVLVSAEKLRSYHYSGQPSSFTGGAMTFDFEFGDALTGTFFGQASQAFDQVFLTEGAQTTASLAQLVIEPEVTHFDFRLDMGAGPLIGMFATFAAEAEIRLAANVYTPDRSLAFRVTGSGHGSSAATGFSFSNERNTADATSTAILDASRNLIKAIVSTPEFERIIRQTRSG